VKNLKNFFMNLPLKYKITILNFIIVFISTVFLAGNFYAQYKENVVREIGNYQMRNADIIGNNIGLIENNIESLSTNLLLNQGFQELLNLTPSQVENRSLNSSSLDDMISLALNTLVSNDYISYISVYTSNNFSFYYSKYNRANAFANIKTSPDYKKMLALRGEPLWTTLSEDSGYFTAVDKSGPKLTMLKSIIDLQNYTVQGFMIVCIDWSTIWSYVPDTGDNAYILTDGSGKVISVDTNCEPIKNVSAKGSFSFDGSLKKPDNSIIKINGDDYLYAKSEVANSNYYIISLMPMNHVAQTANSEAPALLFFVLVCLIFSLFASFFTATIVTKPIKKLIKAIHHVKKGDLTNKVDFRYQDEIGVLGDEYNNMVDELNRLFNKVLQLEIRNRESEIKAMQAQINPHFLYNTLDSIYLKALNSSNETAEMIYALSRILRLTLSRSGELTAIEDEKKFIESYLSLQQWRFKDRFDYEIEIDPKMLMKKILKLILQPFVENAIVHGINIDSHLHIRIEGRYLKGMLEFTVQDNGCGIDKELLDKILNGSVEDSGGGSHGFAIRNVKERLKLYYGSAEPLSILSTPGEGTTVIIRIPEGGIENVSTSDS
jgi:two-component system sensor histidine kinase YesM